MSRNRIAVQVNCHAEENTADWDQKKKEGREEKNNDSGRVFHESCVVFCFRWVFRKL